MPENEHVVCYLMHASADVAIGQPLNLLAGLDEETAIWDADRNAAAVLKPDSQPREARLSMDGQEIEVIMVPGIAAAELTILAQIST